MSEAPIKVLFFSVFRDLTGQEEFSISVREDGIKMGDLLKAVFEEFPALADWKGKMLCAVNCEYADEGTTIQGGDEVALMPPVQGG